MMKFREHQEILQEWDDMIARVKADEVSVEEAKAFLDRETENNARRSNSRLMIEGFRVREAWEKMYENAERWGHPLDENAKASAYAAWCHLRVMTRETISNVKKRMKDLATEILLMTGRKNGADKNANRVLAMADAMEALSAKHRREMSELEAKYKPWWKDYVPRGKTKHALRMEMLWLYAKLLRDRNIVLASYADKSYKQEEMFAEILETIFESMPKALREGSKGPSFSKDGRHFSYEGLKREWPRHMNASGYKAHELALPAEPPL